MDFIILVEGFIVIITIYLVLFPDKCRSREENFENMTFLIFVPSMRPPRGGKVINLTI